MTVFEEPESIENFIPRNELFHKLDETTEHIIFISAPAGYGKTVALSAWTRKWRNRKAWISLDEYDDNPYRFYELFLSALCHAQKANKKLQKQLERIRSSFYPLEVLMNSLQLLLDNEKEYLVILDDWHRIHHKEIRSSLPLILKRMPERWKFIILSRQLPHEDLADYVWKGNMAVLSAQDLKFQVHEIMYMFQKSKQTITEAEAEKILVETDGWAIAINARRMGKSAFGGVGETLFDNYLDSQLWGSIDSKTQEMLIKTSVVEVLEVSLCGQITGLADCVLRFEQLCRQNAFIYRNNDGSFRAHHLFRKYLLDKFSRLDESQRNEILEKTACWYFDKGLYFIAAEYFIKANHSEGASRSLQETSIYNVTNDIEWRVAYIDKIILSNCKTDFIVGSINLVRHSAWIYFLKGNAKEFEYYLDIMYEKMRRITDSKTWETCTFVASLDYRILASTFMDNLKTALSNIQLPLAQGQKIRSASITFNLPHAHRSMRDYSECANDLEAFLQCSKESIGVLLGEGYDVIQDCVYAGIAYEKNSLELARQAAEQAVARCSALRCPEIQFCAHMILVDILYAQNDEREARRVETAIEEIIENEKAFYLEPNFRSHLIDKYLKFNMRNSAREWLAQYKADTAGTCAFYKVFQNYTTARAYIVLGETDKAVLLLKKLSHMGYAYRRPLDVLQANILLSLAYWGDHERQHALEALQRAVQVAQKYGYTRMFLNENQQVMAVMIQTLIRSEQARAVTTLDLAFLKSLKIAGIQQKAETVQSKPLESLVKLSKKQREVLMYMCTGLSYQDIADRMKIGKSTVKTHAQKIFVKLNVNTYEAAVIKAGELKIIKDT